MPEITVEVPAIGLLGHDHITAIRVGDGAEQQVDWLVTHLHDQACPDHGVKHPSVEYEIGKGDDKTTAEHCFNEPDTWLTVHRHHAAHMADTPLLAEAC